MLKEIHMHLRREKQVGILYVTDDLKMLRELLADGKRAAAVLTEENRGEDLSGIAYLLERIEELEERDYERIYRRLSGLPWEILETERCLLREVTEEDLDALYALYAEKSITRYMEDLYEDPEAERKYITDYRKYVYAFYEYGMWVIEEKESGRLIGRAGIDPHDGKHELGYMIGVPWQRQGYAYEVCRAVLAYAWQEIEGCQEIYSRVQAENTASVRLLEKLGFEKVGSMDKTDQADSRDSIDGMAEYRIRKEKAPL